MTEDMELCCDGFHSDECPGCGMSAEDRDEPANATNAAMNYGDGVAARNAEIAEAVRGLFVSVGRLAPVQYDAGWNAALDCVLAIIEKTP